MDNHIDNEMHVILTKGGITERYIRVWKDSAQLVTTNSIVWIYFL